MRLLLVGFGTVGRGVAESLAEAREELRGAGCHPRIVAVLDPVVGSVVRPEGLEARQLLALADDGRSLTEYPDSGPAPGLAELIRGGAAEVIVEATPTNLETGEPGLGHLRQALNGGLHAITTNKGPVVLAYRELTDLARRRGVQLRFEGTVLSGTPVLNLCESGLVGAGIRSIRGVVNGTCNFILSEMENGIAFQQALEAAQRLGYAEADPSGDVDGWDAAAKAVILANCVLGADLSLGDVARTGIGEIRLRDMEEAQRAGATWRLVASVEGGADGWRAEVAPQQVNADDPLASISGPGNLLVFETEALGAVVVSGPGAGRRATGHSVIADLVAIARSVRRDSGA